MKLFVPELAGFVFIALLLVFSEAVVTVMAVPAATMAVPVPPAALNTPNVAVEIEADAPDIDIPALVANLNRVKPAGSGRVICVSVLAALKSTVACASQAAR